MAIKLLSKPLVEKELANLKIKCDQLKAKGIHPSMKVILVGENPASLIYTRNKKKFCEKFGAKCEIINLAKDISVDKFLQTIKDIAADSSAHGCFVQLPLPAHLAGLDVPSLIPPEKDVDGFHAENINKLFYGDKGVNALIPCTPKGVITLLHHYDIDTTGKDVVILGRSHIVGRPMALLALNHDATVTICHSKTSEIKEKTRNADIIISAIGQARFLTKDYLGNKNPVIIDVGINHDNAGKLCGDVDFDDVFDSVSAITPVPGGVGPMTILSLAQNLLQAAEKTL